MVVMRDTPAVEGAKWNPRQVRSVHAEAKSPKLIRFRTCVAQKMKAWRKGLDHAPNLAEVQRQFAEVAKACKTEVA